MSTFLDEMFAKAKSDLKTIVLPEGADERTISAAKAASEAGIANLIVLSEESIPELETCGIKVINHKTSELREELANSLFELRKHKGVDLEKAYGLLNDELYFGVMLVKAGYAHGMVSGACHSTADVLRPSLQILKTSPGVSLVSTFFIMIVPNCEYGSEGVFLFSDCGLEVQPNSEKLAQIGIASAQSWKRFFDDTPRVAFLSHSSYGSAKNDDASKVQEAVKLAKEIAPEIEIDGELQLDAAIVPEVAALKAPDSNVAGKANVLIFPDLDAGNIGYKLVQRLAHAQAYGPITQGIAAPVNDLSRGCSAQDIIGVIAITCVQAQANA
jgi:phosphate acetyltransferase